MSAAASRSEHQRAYGQLRVDMQCRDGRTGIAVLRQEGCLKARFPRPVDWAEVVTLNTSGGVAGGDRLDSAITVRAGGQCSVASQAAERFYRALPGDPPARLRVALGIEAGARLEWLPQESIFFDDCAADRMLAVDMAEDGWFLGVESLVFGRAAMGERVRRARLRDVIRVRRGGRLVLHDAVRFEGAVAALLDRPAGAGGGNAMATLVHVAADAEASLDVLRASWMNVVAETGASAWDGMLVGRVVARSGEDLRAAVIAGLQALRAGRAMPRVWMC